VESYLSGMFNPTVQLKSGGYIVIGVTEALVAIDVNSGRATKEGSIEETALKTNLEAADEVARQLRLRDLAGLIVIDFIDMDERKNNAAVEKRIKEKLKSDRARIQIGRISGFGLLEMSRQRLRPGMLESTTQPCPHCHGTGLIRSDGSMALTILRAIEEEGTRKRSREVLVRAPVAVANFLMNAKREHVAGIEARYGLSVRVEADPLLVSPDFTLEKFKTATRFVPEAGPAPVSLTAELMAQVDEEDDQARADDADEETQGTTAHAARAESADDETAEGKSRKRRRRRRRPSDRSRDEANGQDSDTLSKPSQTEGEAAGDGSGSVPSDSRAGGSPVALPEAIDLKRADDAEMQAEALPGSTSRSDPRDESLDSGANRSEADIPATVQPASAAETEPHDTPVETEAVAELAVLDGMADPVSEPATQAAVGAAGAPDPAVETVADTAIDTDTPAEGATDAQVTAASIQGDAGVATETAAARQPRQAQPATAGADMSVSRAANHDKVVPDRSEEPKRRGWWSVG
ncbi:MAG: ribonuclease E/G, partial [Paracoccus sp. (in: a-proteobacteria)]|nr:ribonuclease E/G [Paracoccus sp. (in: a-proteobacteria)]